MEATIMGLLSGFGCGSGASLLDVLLWLRSLFFYA